MNHPVYLTDIASTTYHPPEETQPAMPTKYFDTSMCHVGLSTNPKTGRSLNFALSSCAPSLLCPSYCYCRRREGSDGMANSGPITRDRQQEMYRSNSAEMLHLGVADMDDIHELAEAMAEYLHRTNNSHIRFCGQGDLTPGSVRLAVALAANDILVWGFSRKPDMISMLAREADKLSIFCARPHFLGSVDQSTDSSTIAALISATKKLDGRSRLAAAVIAGRPNKSGQRNLEAMAACAWLDSLGADLLVSFGYHGTAGRTVLGHRTSCPITEGDHTIDCTICGRCMGRIWSH